MAFAQTHSVALQGAVGHLIDVQADVSQGVVGTTLVGRADASLNEGRDRVRMAITNSGLEWPATRRITVLLAPADLPKAGTHYDLAIAVAVLAAADAVPARALARTALIGELSLDGGLRPVLGVLPMVLAASRRGVDRVVVPEPHVAEASLVPGIEVIGPRSLAQTVAMLRGDLPPEAPPVPELSRGSYLRWRGAARLDEVDMADLVGLDEAKFAVEVAAAGGHHLLLTGAKGCGKTSLAERIPGILPDLDTDEAIELTTLHSLAGSLDPTGGLIRRPPYSAPHHDASKASLVGGGSGRVRPGQVSMAHGGVLFLDEFALFRTDVIDALREPLENGDITIARGEEVVTLPARAMVVLASNPCPCGNAGARVGRPCECRPMEIREYNRRVRGPISDRIDITRVLQPPSPQHYDDFTGRDATARIRAKVTAARAVQAERYAGRDWRLNGQAPGAELRDRWPLTLDGAHQVNLAVLAGQLSRRGAVRVHRLAWTVADLLGVERPGVPEVMTALDLRLGRSLPESLMRRWAA
ncbi:YifB family Mg chelatase-like AAA ATPase [Nocardioides sp.]|uniref:YifB family Mg chelatase-like AAA ATPase n=1 Tax=Nocardioides sp. TaxID=35761 RepID=UPI0039E5CE45